MPVSEPVFQLPCELASQLNKIMASPEFASAPKLRAFLAYVVAQTAAGRHKEIKESRVGVAVYHKPNGYDPHMDATVRVEALKLRLRLHGYYSTAGRNDRIRISIPKGTYVPVIEWCE